MPRPFPIQNLLSPFRPDTIVQSITRRAQMLERFGSCVNGITLEHSPAQVNARLKRCMTEIRGFFPEVCNEEIRAYAQHLEECRPLMVLPEAMKGNKDAATIMALHNSGNRKSSHPSIQKIEQSFSMLDRYEQNLDLVFIERLLHTSRVLAEKFNHVHRLKTNRSLLNASIQQTYRMAQKGVWGRLYSNPKPTELAVQPFSISVILSNRSFSRLTKNSAVEGLHIKNSIFNFIRHNEDLDALTRCIEHEEYHSICEASGRIGHSNPLIAFQELYSVVKIASDMLEHCDRAVAEQITAAIEALLSKNNSSVFLDLVHEELLTDFRAVQRIFRGSTRSRFQPVQANPFNSFLAYWTELAEHIARVSASGNPRMIHYGVVLCAEIDELWPRVFDNYVALHAGCSAVEPEDALFTEALMHLFPPSQIHFAARICEKEIRNFPKRQRLSFQSLRF